MVLIGEFLIFPNWITLIYFVAATWLVHRQVLREEEYLKGITAGLTSSIAIASEGIFEQAIFPGVPDSGDHRIFIGCRGIDRWVARSSRRHKEPS
jgi:hypothetical protein